MTLSKTGPNKSSTYVIQFIRTLCSSRLVFFEIQS